MMTPPPAPSMRVGLDGTFGSNGTGFDGAGGAADLAGVDATGMSRRPSMGISKVKSWPEAVFRTIITRLPARFFSFSEILK